MAAFEVIALDTATPQLRAPGASDTYTFPRAVEMPLGTANGVLYLNGSKVVTSGSGLTFDGTTFVVGANNPSLLLSDTDAGTRQASVYFATAGGNWSIEVANDLVIKYATPGGPITNGSYIQLGRIADPMSFGINGTEQMRLTSTGLGIGELNPQNKLHVVGTSRFQDLASARTMLIEPSQTGAYHRFYSTNTAAGYSFENNTAYLLTIDSLGNLGTGASSNINSSKILATGTIISNQNTISTFSGEYAGFDRTSGRVMRIFSGSGSASGSSIEFSTGVSGSISTRMTLDASGNLGLGVTPSAWTIKASQVLTSSLSSDGNDAYLTANGFFDGSWKYVASDFAAQYYQVNGAHAWRTAPSGTAGNAISFTQAMTLHASGGLSVGSTSDPGANTIALTKLSMKVDGPFFTGANIDSGSNQLGIGVSSGTAAVGLFTANTERIRIKSQGQLRYIPLAADPAGAENGDVYYNSTTNKLRVYAGGAWVDLH